MASTAIVEDIYTLNLTSIRLSQSVSSILKEGFMQASLYKGHQLNFSLFGNKVQEDLATEDTSSFLS